MKNKELTISIKLFIFLRHPNDFWCHFQSIQFLSLLLKKKQSACLITTVYCFFYYFHKQTHDTMYAMYINCFHMGRMQQQFFLYSVLISKCVIFYKITKYWHPRHKLSIKLALQFFFFGSLIVQGLWKCINGR